MEIAQLKAVLCPQSATAARALAEAKASEQRAEQLHASAEQKEQASVAQSLSVNRERLQLATETRDITQLRQEAEQQAAEVSRTVFLHPLEQTSKDSFSAGQGEIAKAGGRHCQAQTAAGAHDPPVALPPAGGRNQLCIRRRRIARPQSAVRSRSAPTRGWRRWPPPPARAQAHPRRRWQAAAGTTTTVRHSPPVVAQCSLRCLLLVAAKTQLLLKEHNRFLEQLKQRPARREPQYSASHAQAPLPQTVAHSDSHRCGQPAREPATRYDDETYRGEGGDSVNRTLDYQDAADLADGERASSSAVELSGATVSPGPRQAGLEQPSGTDESSYSFPSMVPVDISQSSVVSASPMDAVRAGAASLAAA